MKIIVAKGAGFCFGVRRAAEIVDRVSSKGKPVQTYGPLIHNPSYIDKLAHNGVTVAHTADDVKASELVTRTHGITKELEDSFEKLNTNVTDATCPFVKKVQKLAEDYSKRDYKVIILGEPGHPEMVSVVSYAPEALVVNDIKHIPEFGSSSKILFISQTTQSSSKFTEISDYLQSLYPNIEIINTICGATENNQKEVAKLSKKVDLMIVVGGKESSNTTRLREVAEENVTTKHVLSADEIKPEWFIGVKTVGIAAGASTPDFSIEEVIKRIETI